MPDSKLFLRVVALVEWMLVLPATVFLTAALLRLMQPPQYEPARTSWAIVNWTVRTLSQRASAIVLLGLPGLVAIAGSVALLRSWRADERLRSDAMAAIAAVWRHREIVVLGAAVVLAMAIVALVVGHSIADFPQ
ncbi:MAG TPA: hypothetical protein VMH00_01610 [Candidatus Limnocylindrales bacterium]|nr:hypothetical protein [Candidatus Limnocylindrales bacterium]